VTPENVYHFWFCDALRDPSDAAKWCLLDTLGCALFGYEEAWARIMAEEMLAECTNGRSTIVG
jgi:2-methylcitrate dehydratase PrpD